MNIAKTIQYLHPTLEVGRDYEYRDDSNGKGPYIKWHNKDIPEPTQDELDNAWVIVEQEIKEAERQANIRKDISETIIDFKGGKFKMRKKDFTPLLAQFIQIKEDSVEPVTVLDSEYKQVQFTYADFIEFKGLVGKKQQEIIIKYN